ncbi:hypothetical protein BTO30_10950 [Domibacillus antri]|uniref:DUF3862 domain-containing protein n=1 Tax=Domibacillus antri TaxID=1714264 RepID=A0A1Q8Q4K7_9BACI|nr:hypothetical protein [Domibacillus antri]OLN22258.1 hypothetical protein BTO30_10950 [Domibacillus antri]
MKTKVGWIVTVLCLSVGLAACQTEKTDEETDDATVSDTFDPDREIEKASAGKLTKAVFYKVKSGMTVEEATETLGVELTLHTEIDDPASDAVVQVYMWDSKDPEVGGAMFIFENGLLASKEESLMLEPDDHFVTGKEYDALQNGMSMADVEAIIGSQAGMSTMSFEKIIKGQTLNTRQMNF